MSPSDPKTPTDAAELRAADRSASAAVVVAKVELRAAEVVWKADAANRKHVISAIMAASRDYARAIEESAASTSSHHTHRAHDGHNGVGPDCKDGFHEEFGICVPDN